MSAWWRVIGQVAALHACVLDGVSNFEEPWCRLARRIVAVYPCARQAVVDWHDGVEPSVDTLITATCAQSEDDRQAKDQSMTSRQSAVDDRLKASSGRPPGALQDGLRASVL